MEIEMPQYKKIITVTTGACNDIYTLGGNTALEGVNEWKNVFNKILVCEGYSDETIKTILKD